MSANVTHSTFIHELSEHDDSLDAALDSLQQFEATCSRAGRDDGADLAEKAFDALTALAEWRRKL